MLEKKLDQMRNNTKYVENLLNKLNKLEDDW